MDIPINTENNYPNYQSCSRCTILDCNSLKISRPEVEYVSLNAILRYVAFLNQVLFMVGMYIIDDPSLVCFLSLASLLLQSFFLGYFIDQLSTTTSSYHIPWLIYSSGNLPEMILSLTALPLMLFIRIRPR